MIYEMEDYLLVHGGKYNTELIRYIAEERMIKGRWPTLAQLAAETASPDTIYRDLEELVKHQVCGLRHTQADGVVILFYQPFSEQSGFLQELEGYNNSVRLAQNAEAARQRALEQEAAKGCQPTSPETYIYMMKDLSTGSVKIGRSKLPEYRERTLQSEKPSIELLGAWPGAKSDEKRLHAMFAHKRKRGEWFMLSRADVRVVRTYCETIQPSAE